MADEEGEIFMKNAETKSEAMKVSFVSIVVNVVLSVFKFAAGVIANSGAMISDAVHSLSDVLSTFVVIAGLKLSAKKNDAEHPYGHERMECVAAIILSIMLALVGVGIGYSGIEKIISGNSSLKTPGALALVAAIVSIAVKEWMYWYTRSVAKREMSDALMADAWHHRSDALSSVGSFVGIGGALLGYPVLDAVASVVICVFIMKAAIDIFRGAIDKMVDRACDPETTRKIRDIILDHDNTVQLDMLKTRMFGSKVFVDVEFSMDGNVTLREAHAVADHIHNEIEEKIPMVKHCMIHVNPQ